MNELIIEHICEQKRLNLYDLNSKIAAVEGGRKCSCTEKILFQLAELTGLRVQVFFFIFPFLFFVR